MTQVALVLSLLTVLMAGLMAGTFFTWSNAVMTGLDAIEPRQAIAAMRGMNDKILNPLFLAVFMLTGIVGFAAALLLWIDTRTGAAVAMFIAAGFYVLGSNGITASINVPMNNKLVAASVPDDEAAVAKMWTDFSSRWRRWNSVRALLCAVSLVMAGLSLYLY
ncbi:MAG: DUF1772 domain-containing protein [Stackebrandtia sp.]